MTNDQNNNLDEPIIKTETTAKATKSEEKLSDITNPKSTLTDEEKDINANKEIAGMSYVWILSVPIYLFRKDSPFIQKHAKQGLYLFYCSLFAWFLATIPYIWWIGFVLLMIYLFIITKGLLKAITGNNYYVPFLTDFLTTNKKEATEGTNEDAEEFITSQKENPKDVEEIITKQQEEEKETLTNISEKVHDVLEVKKNTENDDKDVNTK